MGSSFSKKKLEKDLGEYIILTLTWIKTVQGFCDKEPQWTLQRKCELEMMRSIKDRADQRLKREAELGEVLTKTLAGLEELHHFLDAVEKLAVTSLFVFNSNKLMPEGFSSNNVCSAIIAARNVSPLLILFTRDAEAFFMPSFCNVDVLVFELDKYIHITQRICRKMKSLCYEVAPNCCKPRKWKNGKLSLKFDWRIRNKLLHLRQLINIRMDESFRLTFLFGVKAQDFINIFSERRSRMFQFLSDLEKAATKLDKMKKGSNISSVAGSSLSIAGGICSIIGLALAPVSAGASLGLTLTGAGLGVTSGITGFFTGITETAVNIHQSEKANNIFIRFMKDIEELLDVMGQAGGSERPAELTFGVNLVHEAGKLAVLGESVAQDIVEFVDVTSGLHTLKNEEAIARTAKIGLKRLKTAQKLPAHAVNLPDVGQMAKGGLSKSARLSFITVNALFIGVDVFLLYRDIQNLSEGRNSKEAQLIRSRAALWRSEVETWEKIFKHLSEGISAFDKNWEVLQQPFHM